MENIHAINLLQFTIEDKDVMIYRSFKQSIKDSNFPIFTKKRLRFKHFYFDKARRILLSYTDIISNYDYDIISRLNAMKKLYNYILIFISDIFKHTIRFVLNGLYVSILRLMKELDNNTYITNGPAYLKKLKKNVKHSMQKVINAIKYICTNNTSILIRLPYSIFSTITNYDIYKVYAEYDGAVLDKNVARALNNTFKINTIPIFIKKLNIYIILYILKYLTFAEESYYTIFDTFNKINNSKHLIIKDGNSIKIII